jgi:acyl-CoA reductase-like NAD-dependent aldehyde dehydrogenase
LPSPSITAFEGQKCSACSRAYFPDNLWPQIREKLIEELQKVHMGQPDGTADPCVCLWRRLPFVFLCTMQNDL